MKPSHEPIIDRDAKRAVHWATFADARELLDVQSLPLSLTHVDAVISWHVYGQTVRAMEAKRRQEQFEANLMAALVAVGAKK